MLPVINAFKTAHQLTDVTVVADAGMISRSQPGRAAGRGVVVHPGHPHPRRARRWCANGATNTLARTIPDGHGVDPAVAGHRRREGPRDPGSGRSTTSTATTGPGAPCAGSMSRSPKPNGPSTGTRRSNATASSSSPVPPRSVNRDLEAKTRALGRVEGLCRCRGYADRRCVVDWWGSCRGWIARHNHRLCSQVSKGSAGWYAPARVSGWRVRSRALRLMAMSAWR